MMQIVQILCSRLRWTTEQVRSMLTFVSFAPALDPFGEGTEMRCVLCMHLLRLYRNFGAPQKDNPQPARDNNPRSSRHSSLSKV
jgi:hypothetical protein